MADGPIGPAPTSHHGASIPRGLDAPADAPTRGRFGRMFPCLPAGKIDVDGIDKLVAAMSTMSGTSSRTIPAGYTYFGQFVDHDLTFDPTSVLDKANDPLALTDFRTPRLDLDSVYGAGPSDQPFLYEWADHRDRGVKLLVGANPPFDADGHALATHDLQRNAQGRALIGDMRNDENLIVSQLHLLVIRFHNAVVEHVRRERGFEGRELFTEAQRLVRWHYQWVVVHDFLRRVVGETMLASVLGPDDRVRRQFYVPDGEPFMPFEFSAAAYRFGHSMVRISYSLEPRHPEHTTRIFGPGNDHLGGFRRLPQGLEIHWERFFDLPGQSPPQASRAIDVNIANPLFSLPSDVSPDEPKLARLNMLRALKLELPSGPAVAHAMGHDPLDAAALGDAIAGFPAELADEVPLWLYILCEASLLGGGERLGPTGGQIVAEVLLGLLAADAHSYLGQSPGWQPDFRDALTNRFEMPELVRFAGYDPNTGAFS